ncbi:MAG: Uma2 family endonuclease [Dehalococcoidia bacterium]
MVQATSSAAGQSRWPRMSYEDYLCDPTIPAHTEWVDGEVVEMMSVSKAHAEMLDFLLELFHTFFRHSRPGRIYQDPFNMKTAAGLPGRAPDLMFVKTENLPRVTDKHLAGPADLAIEIISEGTGHVDRGAKFYEYQAGGVREYWIIDPVRELAEFHVLDDAGVFRAALGPEDGVFESTVVEGLSLRVEWLWSRPPGNEIEAELVSGLHRA